MFNCVCIYMYVKQGKIAEMILCELFKEYLHILFEISPPFLKDYLDVIKFAVRGMLRCS